MMKTGRQRGREIIRLFALSFCVYLLGNSTSGTLAAPAKPHPALGASLARMALFDLDGKRYEMSEVKSKRVVVVFWAFWCDTWRKALPYLQDLQEKGEELDCAIWTVSVDGTYTASVRPLAASGRIPFPVLLDEGTWRDKLGLRRVPTVVLLDTSRCAVSVYEGYPGNAVLVSALRRIR